MLKSYDVCIVGAGIAGSLLAERLARGGAKVALIEAGSRFSLTDRLTNLQRSWITGTPLWPWEMRGRDDYVDNSKDALGYEYPLNQLRVKGVGGSTLHWGGLAQRFRESDFETYTRYGYAADWPITYTELEPYYVQAEHEIGVSGEQNPDDPPRSAPLPMPAFPPSYIGKLWIPVLERQGVVANFTSEARNSIPYRGRSQCVAYAMCRTCPSGARYSADFHADLAIRTGHCDLFERTVARLLEVDRAGHVKSLQVTDIDGRSREIQARFFVVAAHAIESARLLQLSGIDRYLDSIGRYLMEHWYLGFGGMQEHQLYPGRIGFDTLESVHFYDGKERFRRGAIKLEFGSGHNEPIAEAMQQGLAGRQVQKLDCEQFGYRLSLGAEVEHAPNPESRVTLHTQKKDMFGDPVPVIRFVLSEFDRATHDSAARIVQDLLTAKGVKDIRPGQQFGPGGHHMGTCRMGNDPATSVTDRNAAVHGFDNLFCAGSSLFTTGGARQPTLTIAALSLRLAEHLSTLG
ncbi:MAG: GMC family oxidoreductase [Pseudomonadales bacterium]|nr:GMC family oxidoreductase [Pseudomonadales bacterium]MCP5185066.1 GMC family oxidoreductase [Pseudomonadales bacterium]